MTILSQVIDEDLLRRDAMGIIVITSPTDRETSPTDADPYMIYHTSDAPFADSYYIEETEVTSQTIMCTFEVGIGCINVRPIHILGDEWISRCLYMHGFGRISYDEH